MPGRMEDRVAVVTGGASGIGRVTARYFGREGAKVVVSTDADVQGGEESAACFYFVRLGSWR